MSLAHPLQTSSLQPADYFEKGLVLNFGSMLEGHQLPVKCTLFAIVTLQGLANKQPALTHACPARPCLLLVILTVGGS